MVWYKDVERAKNTAYDEMVSGDTGTGRSLKSEQKERYNFQ